MPNLGIINRPYVSAIDSMLDTREIAKQVTDIYNEDNLTDMLNLAGRTSPVTQSVYYTFVNEKLFKLGDTTGATVTGSGTATIGTTFTSATSGYIRKNDLVIFPSGNKVGIVTARTTASNADSVTIKSVDGSNITHTAGDKLAIFSNAVGSGSAANENISYGFTKYSNKVQIFNETSIIDDVQGASTLEVEIDGKPYFIVKDHLEKQIKLKAKINGAFIAGQMSTTTFSDANPTLTDQYTATGALGGAVQTTRGIDKYVAAYGSSSSATTLGSVVTADLDALHAVWIANRAPKKQLAIGSSTAKIPFDKYFKSLGSSGITSARLQVDGKSLDLTMDTFKYGKFEIVFGEGMEILDHPEIFSQTDIAKSMYFLPYDYQVPVYGSAGTVPAISIKYMKSQSPFGNEMIGESYDGALAFKNPAGTVQKAITHWTTTQGLEVVGAQYFSKFTTVS